VVFNQRTVLQTIHQVPQMVLPNDIKTPFMGLTLTHGKQVTTIVCTDINIVIEHLNCTNPACVQIPSFIFNQAFVMLTNKKKQQQSV
jgi:hypothetical protein